MHHGLHVASAIDFAVAGHSRMHIGHRHHANIGLLMPDVIVKGYFIALISAAFDRAHSRIISLEPLFC